MAKAVDRKLIDQIRKESERTKADPYPAGATFTRPNRERSRVYSIRLSDAEYAAVQQVADAAHLPASTLVRSWILARLEQERPAYDTHAAPVCRTAFRKPSSTRSTRTSRADRSECTTKDVARVITELVAERTN